MVLVPIEVRCRLPRVHGSELCKVITHYIRQHHTSIRPGAVLSLTSASDLLTAAVDQLRVCDVYCPLPSLPAEEADYVPLLYALRDGDAFAEPLDDNDDDASLPACTVLALPSPSLEGLWESLHYGDTPTATASLKRDLLQYARAVMVFAAAQVSPHRVAWNRLLLLHGPPGTGKTSLCRALAQKLAIRLGDLFPSARLVEVNAHSLFSRWFSESGKQVMMLFRRLHEMAEEETCLLCVLVDEVESLAAARQAAMRGNEPSDAIRVVNALLTQLDSLQRRRNVLVLATSNITGAIDVAFIDRADKKVYIGQPGMLARRTMLQAATEELIQRGLVQQEDENGDSNGTQTQEGEQWRRLEKIAERTVGFSGRTIKKLPLLAYSEHTSSGAVLISLTSYMDSLEMAVNNEIATRAIMSSEE